MSVCPSVRMNAETSETIRARLLRFGVRLSVCPSVRLSVRMNAEISQTMGARLLRFGVQIPKLHQSQVCFSNVPRPLLRPQTAQNCGSYSFDARIKILNKCILLINTYQVMKKSLP